MDEDGREQEPAASLEERILTFGPKMAFPDQPRAKKLEKAVREWGSGSLPLLTARPTPTYP